MPEMYTNCTKLFQIKEWGVKTFESFCFFRKSGRRIGQCASDGGQISPTIVAFVLKRILLLSITF